MSVWSFHGRCVRTSREAWSRPVLWQAIAPQSLTSLERVEGPSAPFSSVSKQWQYQKHSRWTWHFLWCNWWVRRRWGYRASFHRQGWHLTQQGISSACRGLGEAAELGLALSYPSWYGARKCSSELPCYQMIYFTNFDCLLSELLPRPGPQKTLGSNWSWFRSFSGLSSHFAQLLAS